jgi:hypothetical protein
MASTSETGHANNVANLESLITSITAYGTSYNPSKESIKLSALQNLLIASQNAIYGVNTALSAYSIAVNARETAFAPLGRLITRVNNALKASDSSTQIDESAQTIIRKLQGKRAGAKLTDEEKKTLEAEGKTTIQISVSQMSYDGRLANLDKLISFLSTVPQYTPNEEELKIESLKTLCNDLKTKNAHVVSTGIQLDNARNNRNEILYKPLTGLIDLASDAKTYLKSLFGATSPQYKQVSKLTFIARN